MGRVFYNYASLRRVSAHAQIQRRLRNGHIATGTAEEREARLAKHRVRDVARRAAESEEMEQARLAQLRSNQAKRIAAESSEEREARLQPTVCIPLSSYNIIIL